MVLPLKRTLGEMRSEMQTRLGFGMSGQAGIVNSPIMDSFLRSAQQQLYEAFDWRELCAVDERLTGQQQKFYDYPADCNIERIQRIAILSGGEWQELKEGISLAQRSVEVGDYPLAYERRDQIELWPVPAAQYQMRTEYVKTLGEFDQSSDRASLPSEMIFLFALANAKAHYRQPDAPAYQQQADAQLARLKAYHRGKNVWTKETPGMYSRDSKDAYYSYPR